MFWIIFSCILLILITLTAVIAVRTYNFRPQKNGHCSDYTESGDLTGAVKLAEAVRIPTITAVEPDKTDWAAFIRFHTLLEEQFPLVHEHCEKTVINDYSLVYCLKSDKPAGKPVLITAHMDVVPVESCTQDEWCQPPFSGTIENGIVWGRGTLDTKAHLIAAMEAMERLLSKGFTPTRDIYMAFGHDEELNGEEGAKKIAAHFKDKGLRFDFVLDEGGCAVQGAVESVKTPIALIGVGEKGYANIRLSVKTDGGHASMPSPHTSLGILSKAICRLEEHPIKPHLIAPIKAFLMKIGPHMRGPSRLALANLWLFKPLFLHVFSKMNSGNALLRTTITATMAQGSPAPNIVPQQSTAVLNCRILPGENGKTLLNHIRQALKGLPVEIKPIHLDDPSALSPTDSEAYRYIESLIHDFCGDVIAAPYLVMAGTDARKYECVCENIFRFSPYVIDNGDIGKIHGTNENISVSNVNRCIDFFTALMERL